ncbi:redoxin domain-containing protein [candidate division GN15 bacterium]|nr:redoxin domain-containing protein [candidate division GN15 bacterium]
MTDGSEENRVLQVGDEAPDFTLPTHAEGEHNLAWYRGRKNVILAFYPADWTPVCATQIPGYVPLLRRFEEYDAQVIGISADSVPCHRAWAKSLGGIPFPLASDFWPHGQVSRRYGVLNKKGFPERAVFVIDKKGIVRHIQRVHPARIPDNDEIFEVLKQLSEEQAAEPEEDDWMRQ